MPSSDAPATLACEEIVLASASRSRARLLQGAGLRIVIEPADLDEADMRTRLRAEGAGARDIADALAGLKAQRVSLRRPGLLVVGADQVLACEDRLFEKPRNLTEARAQLTALSGRTHVLVSAVAAARDGTVIWRHVASARLHMRPLSSGFIEAYLALAGASVLSSVGAYALEGLGAQLFSRVEGDYFTVLGLPLLPLLEFLRSQQVIPA